MKEIKATDYHLFCKFLEKKSGIVLGDTKTYLVSSRLSEILEEHNLNDLTALIKEIEELNNTKLKTKVIDAMTTNETNWFRDIHPYKILTEKIFPDLVAKNIGQTQPLKIWSAASSSGQEAYTIAMAFLEYRKKYSNHFNSGVKILGTDISSEMVASATEGKYDKIAMSRGLTKERIDNFFDPIDDEGGMQVKQQLRDFMKFRSLNLLDSYVLLGKFDIIFCRNVLIYFSKEVKKDIIHRLCESLNVGGYMFLGASENIDISHERFQMIQCNPGIVFKKI